MLIKEILDRVNQDKNESKKKTELKDFFQKDKKEKDKDSKKTESPTIPISKRSFIKLVAFVVALVVVFAILPKKDKTEEIEGESYTLGYDGKTKLKTSDDLLGDVQTKTSVASPDIPVPEEIPTAAVEDGRYYNALYDYSFKIPEGFDVFESKDVVYLRNVKDHTQISIYYLNQTITEPIEVFNRNSSYITKQKALLVDDEGNELERDLIQWARGTLKDETIGDVAVKRNVGTGYYMADSDRLPVELSTSDYFFVTNDNGVCMSGISQTVGVNSVFSVMDSVISTWETTEAKDVSIELATYKDKKTGISFQYPKNWEVTENGDGMVIIKAPNNQSDKNAGTIIEFIADDGNIVSSYTQYSAAYEIQILLPTFIQKVIDTDFDYETAVTKMEMDANIRGMNCYYYEVTDRIFPRSQSIFDSLSILGDTLINKRWCFKHGKYHCMLNIIAPSGQTTVEDIVINSFTN